MGLPSTRQGPTVHSFVRVTPFPRTGSSVSVKRPADSGFRGPRILLKRPLRLWKGLGQGDKDDPRVLEECEVPFRDPAPRSERKDQPFYLFHVRSPRPSSPSPLYSPLLDVRQGNLDGRTNTGVWGPRQGVGCPKTQSVEPPTLGKDDRRRVEEPIELVRLVVLPVEW